MKNYIIYTPKCDYRIKCAEVNFSDHTIKFTREGRIIAVFSLKTIFGVEEDL